MKQEHILTEKLFITKSIKIHLHQPFQWASGIQSPIYCDNRKLLSFPIHRDYVKSELSNIILSHFSDYEIIAGVATAGIPWGVLVADQTKCPFIYVRSKEKEHGLHNQIEGDYNRQNKVVIIEDLVSSGKSSLEVVHVLREVGLEVLGVLSIFTYGLKDCDNLFEKENITHISLTNYEKLLEYAKEKKMFSDSEIHVLSQWKENPRRWKNL